MLARLTAAEATLQRQALAAAAPPPLLLGTPPSQQLQLQQPPLALLPTSAGKTAAAASDGTHGAGAAQVAAAQQPSAGAPFTSRTGTVGLQQPRLQAPAAPGSAQVPLENGAGALFQLPPSSFLPASMLPLPLFPPGAALVDAGQLAALMSALAPLAAAAPQLLQLMQSSAGKGHLRFEDLTRIVLDEVETGQTLVL